MLGSWELIRRSGPKLAWTHFDYVENALQCNSIGDQEKAIHSQRER